MIDTIAIILLLAFMSNTYDLEIGESVIAFIIIVVLGLLFEMGLIHIMKIF